MIAAPKILLVDDVQLFLEITKGFLAMSPVEILTAHDGEEALEIVRHEHPALVVMDINMPKMDGITCCSLIKGDPVLASTPVIMVTNSGSIEDVQQSWRAGCDDFIEKPLDERLFLEKARRFLEVIERRKKRVSFEGAVFVTIDSQISAGVAVDLGYNGMYVANPLEASIGDEVIVSFRLVESSPVNTVARGRVAWLNRAQDLKKPNYPPGFGVEFIEIIGEGLSMLRTNELQAYVDLRIPKR